MKPRIDLEQGSTIVFIGDSITGAGRFEPVYQPYGRGFVHFAAYTLLAKYPQLDLNIINSGISGDTIRDLTSRWESDCLRYRPDVVNILIGVNDLWRQHQGRLSEAVYIDQFEAIYKRLLSETREKTNSQIVLIEPFMFCNDVKNEMFKDLRSYVAVVDKLAEQFDAVLVPVQKFIDDQIENVRPGLWSDDFVHPKIWAHCWIAQRWFEVIGL